MVEDGTVPVIENGRGNCHVYVDETADLSMAADIVPERQNPAGWASATLCRSILVHEKSEEA
ncbi:MAG: hypothetical protein ACLRT5_07175 [Lachnospiraceae bacterium]